MTDKKKNEVFAEAYRLAREKVKRIIAREGDGGGIRRSQGYLDLIAKEIVAQLGLESVTMKAAELIHSDDKSAKKEAVQGTSLAQPAIIEILTQFHDSTIFAACQ